MTRPIFEYKEEEMEFVKWCNARCNVCGKDFTLTEFRNEGLVHRPHELECPNFRKEPNTPLVSCECDLFAHAKCCRECN